METLTENGFISERESENIVSDERCKEEDGTGDMSRCNGQRKSLKNGNNNTVFVITFIDIFRMI